MSKYIIELGEDAKAIQSISITSLGNVYVDSWYVENLEELNSDYINEHFGDLQDTAYQRGLDYAWEAAKKVVLNPDEGGLSALGLNEIFNCATIQQVFRKYTLSEVIAKLKAYEEKQKAYGKIEVGDEVETKDGKRFVVTTFGSSLDCDIAVGVCADGLGLGVDLKELRKTGRHFDIASILEDMKS